MGYTVGMGESGGMSPGRLLGGCWVERAGSRGVGLVLAQRIEDEEGGRGGSTRSWDNLILVPSQREIDDDARIAVYIQRSKA